MVRLNQTKEAQRSRILVALREVKSLGMSTIQMREELDVMSPASRIFELRKQEGYNIQTVWRSDTNAQGREHSCAFYVLLSGKWKEPEKTKAA